MKSDASVEAYLASMKAMRRWVLELIGRSVRTRKEVPDHELESDDSE
jgi:hypothetical protein